MNKKEKRKELELFLVKTIEEVLNKRNTEATKNIKKIITGSSKTIAKKFYKTLKSVVEKKNNLTKKATKKPIKPSTSKAKEKRKK